MDVAVFLNPHSKKNRGRPRRAAELREVVGRSGEVFETRSVGELGDALGDVLGRGARYLVADGGDGSLHWVVNGTRDVLGDEGWPTFVPTNGGTIDFVARKIGIRDGIDAIARLVQRVTRGDPPRGLPLPSLELTGIEQAPSGPRPFRRIGFALAAGGVGARFFDHYYAEPNPGPQTIVKVVARAVASQTAAMVPVPWPDTVTRPAREIFKPTPARVVIDGRELPATQHGALHAGAFDVSLGGVFRVFPLARDPGVLHFQAGALSPTEIIRALPSLVRGGAIHGHEFLEVGGQEMRVTALGEPLRPILDGERLGPLSELTVRRGPMIDVPHLFA